MRSLSHAVGLITQIAKDGDVLLFDRRVSHLAFHHDQQLKAIMFRPETQIMIQVVDVVHLTEVELKTQLKSAMASVFCHMHYSIMQDAHRIALVPSKAEVPVLHTFGSPRWIWYLDKLRDI